MKIAKEVKLQVIVNNRNDASFLQFLLDYLPSITYENLIYCNLPTTVLISSSMLPICWATGFGH